MYKVSVHDCKKILSIAPEGVYLIELDEEDGAKGFRFGRVINETIAEICPDFITWNKFFKSGGNIESLLKKNKTNYESKDIDLQNEKIFDCYQREFNEVLPHFETGKRVIIMLAH